MIEFRPASPCVNVCELDGNLCCKGCRRTLDEIARWNRMTFAEQWAVIARLERLRAQEAHLKKPAAPDAAKR